MTDDMSLPSPERKRRQVEHAPSLTARAQVIKLGDKIANVGDIATNPPPDWSVERRRKYFDWTFEVIAGCRGVNAALERRYDEVLAEARRLTS
jgi:guanosine-3',5'-bis(diphosphate) 3'-pyrophosphohydrolase